jgi:hypothetical protein
MLLSMATSAGSTAPASSPSSNHAERRARPFSPAAFLRRPNHIR